MKSSLMQKVATGVLVAVLPKLVDMAFEKMRNKKQSRVQ